MLIHIQSGKEVSLSRKQIEERGGHMSEFREVLVPLSHKGHDFFKVEERAVMK